jgi:hypothetical protein
MVSYLGGPKPGWTILFAPRVEKAIGGSGEVDGESWMAHRRLENASPVSACIRQVGSQEFLRAAEDGNWSA